MGLVKNLDHPAPPTSIDYADGNVGQTLPEKHGIAADPEAGVERMEFAANGDQQHPHHVNAAMEKIIVRKMDWRLVPLVTALYLLSFLDRSNIGNAKIAGMSTDLNLVGNRYQWLLNMFYISYIVFEFTTIMWKLVPPHIWAAIVVFGWGLIATVQAATTNWEGMMALRFLLGAVEAGFGPGIPYLLSFFYLRHELGLRIGIFLSAAPLANTFAGALAYGITSGKSTLANWRLLFLVEGLPTILMAPVAFFFLPDTPDKARFLNEEERVVAKARGVRQVGHVERIGGVDWKDVLAALLDIKNWLTALMYFSCNVSFSSLPVFLPTILLDMGFTAVNAQGLTAPPYFMSFIITFTSAYLADRWQQRGYMVMFLSAVGCIGYILLASCESVGARYFGVFLACAGVFPAIANILPWVLNNQGSDTRRGMGIVMLNTIGQCGPLLGTNVFPSTQSPRYVPGMCVCGAFIAFNGVLAFTLRAYLARENRKLDEKFGARGSEQAAGHAEAKGESAPGEENYGPSFRYVL